MKGGVSVVIRAGGALSLALASRCCVDWWEKSSARCLAETHLCVGASRTGSNRRTRPMSSVAAGKALVCRTRPTIGVDSGWVSLRNSRRIRSLWCLEGGRTMPPNVDLS